MNFGKKNIFTVRNEGKFDVRKKNKKYNNIKKNFLKITLIHQNSVIKIAINNLNFSYQI